MAFRLIALLIIAVVAGCDQQRSVTVHTPAGLAYRANGGLFHCSPRSSCTFEFPATLDLQDEYILAEAGGHRFAGWRAAQEGALCSHHGVSTPLRAFHAHTPDATVQALVVERSR